jgi:hypothetical protein
MLSAAGWTLVALGLAHAPFWRAFAWAEESKRLSPLNARVFAVHVFFIALVLVLAGALLAISPESLLQPGTLPHAVLAALTVFFGLRLIAQPLVFDPVLAVGSRFRTPLAIAANLAWVFYTALFAVACAWQARGPLLGEGVAWRSPWTWVRLGVAAVWILFGLIFKVLGAVPRHREIVARVLGERWAGPVTRLVGLGECAVGVWMASGWHVGACVAAQTLAIASMNSLELLKARELLLSARWMLLANAGLLGAGWAVVAATAPM